ncbi:Putative LOC100373930, partial [Caligus rogercresseyi]
SCDHTLYVFSLVVIINFWIHLLTPLIFMLSLCLPGYFPSAATLPTGTRKQGHQRLGPIHATPLSLNAFPALGISMIAVGVLSLSHCRSNPAEQEEVLSRIPIWLLVTGASLLFVPSVYLLYDKYCKHEDSGPLIKALSQGVVINYLLLGLSWAIL